MILIIGSKGMLGQDFSTEFDTKKIPYVGWDITDIDITKESDMEKIKKIKPSLLINCAAYTNVDLAETEKEKAYLINVTGSQNLAKTASLLDIPIVQISTDYVFNGTKKEYCETDAKDPIGYYGVTKAQSEDMIQKYCKKYYIVRTSWLFGKQGKNFVETISKLAQEKQELKVVHDQEGKPTYTKDLIQGIMHIINNKLPYGIYHCTNDEVCSWYEFAKEIVRLQGLNTKVIPCTTEEFPRPAKRPQYSVLINTKTPQLRNWKKALLEYMGEKI